MDVWLKGHGHLPPVARERAGRSAPTLVNLLAALLLGLCAAPIGAAEDTNRITRMQILGESLRGRVAERQDALRQARTRGYPIQRVLRDGRTIALRRFQNGRPVYYVTDNTNAALTIATTPLLPGGSTGLGLTGLGQVLGIWDGGSVRNTHQELVGRVSNFDPVGFSAHATHVAGTLIASGQYGPALGMAPAATLRSYDFNSDETEMIIEQALTTPINVSNHSYGLISGWIFDFQNDGLWAWFGDVIVSTTEDSVFGYYGDSARLWDEIAVGSPNYLMVKSAGNDRNEPGPGSGLHWHYNSSVGDFVLAVDTHPADGSPLGYDSLGGGAGMAKNILTVGAVADIPAGYTGPGDVVLASFSGTGPTDDGRIKPDIVANGIELTSAHSQANNTYADFSGTSMSSPNAAGSVALLHEHATNLYGGAVTSATTRALIIHTADEAGPAPGPDYQHGWGLMNTTAAAAVMSADDSATNTGHIYQLALANGAPVNLTFESDGTVPLRATLVWTDPAGISPPQVVDPATRMLVNDLDLTITDPSTVIHQPWILDPALPASAATRGDNTRDNVEQVLIDTTVAGIYSLEVAHKGTLDTPQNFSLVVTGNLDSSSTPPTITSTPNTNTLAGQPYSYDADDTLSATGSQPVTFALLGGPPGLTVDPAGLVTWTPGTSDVGLHPVSIEASNAFGVGVQNFTIDVSLPPTGIVIDNDLAGTSSTGSWPVASGASSHFGTTSRYAVTGGAIDTYRFTPDLPLAGNWDVEAWNSCFSPRHTQVPHVITYLAGSNTVLVDQDCGSGLSGAWLYLGTYNFAAGSTGYVEISDTGLSPAGGAYIGADAVRFTLVGGGTPNTSPTVDAGADQAIVLPANATLDGTTSDDGQVLPLAFSWSQQSGPGVTTFGDPTAQDTTASFSLSGTYVLRLTADDGELTAFDELTVTVAPAVNTSPVVDAGADQAVVLPNAVTLDATVSDDGLIAPVTVSWTQQSGPGTATFADPGSEDTSATFSTAGLYVLRLTADDGEFAVFDELTVTASNPVNTPPVVSAGPDQAVTLPNSATLIGTVSDDGLVSPVVTTWSLTSGPGTVIFGDPSATSTSASFSTDGTFTLRLTADDGEFVVVDELTVTVSNLVNTAPTVDAGPDLGVVLPTPASLAGSVIDDGLIAPLVNAWSQVSGPGTTTFADPTAPTTTATFDIEGTYILRLTADDGEFVGTDDVSVTVTSPPAGSIFYDFDSYPGTFTTWNAAALPDAGVRNGHFYADITANASNETLWWNASQGRSDGSLHDLPLEVIARGVGVAPFQQDAAALPYASGDYAFAGITVHDEIDTSLNYLGMFAGHRGKPDTILGARTQNGSTGTTDAGADAHTGRVDLRLVVNADGTHTAYWQTAGLPVDNWQLYLGTGQLSNSIPIYSSNRVKVSVMGYAYLENALPFSAVIDSLEIIEGAPVNDPPVVDAGPDLGITLPAQANLDATVTDDGSINPVTVLWTQVSGPGVATFADASAIDTTAAFSLAGVYVLRLTADDGEFTPFDEVSVVVSDPPANQPPVVSAGADASVIQPAAAILDGTVLDDGLLQPISTLWTQQSGPGSTTFADDTAVDTTATFSADGTYLLRLTADDGEFILFDEVEILVSTPVNTPPTVTAGPDVAVVLPAPATLNGIVGDDGLIQPVTQLWTQQSGPGTTTFADASSTATTATFSVDGTYVFRLTADDGALTAFDEVTVTASVAVNNPPTVDAGVDLAVTLPGAASLNATVSDDGLALPLTFTWSQLAGPGTTTFASANAEDTTATFSVDGIYTLQLEAFDGEHTTSDSLVVTVSPAAPGSIVHDFSVWPASFVTYNGTAVPAVGVRDGRYYADVTSNAGEVTLWWGSFQGRADGSLHSLPVEVIARGAGVAPLGLDDQDLPYASSVYAFAAIMVRDENPASHNYLQMSAGHRGKPLTITGNRTFNGSSGTTDEGPNAHSGRVDMRLVVNADGSHTAWWQPAGTVPDNWQLYRGTGLLATGAPNYSSGTVRVEVSGYGYLEQAVPFTAVIDSLEIIEQ